MTIYHKDTECDKCNKIFRFDTLIMEELAGEHLCPECEEKKENMNQNHEKQIEYSYVCKVCKWRKVGLFPAGLDRNAEITCEDCRCKQQTGLSKAELDKNIQSAASAQLQGDGPLQSAYMKMMGSLARPQQKDHDPVNHPKHYTSDPSGVECIEVTRHRNYNVGNAIKYLWRAGLKDADTDTQDLEKAVWYIQDEIKRIKGEHKPRTN